MRIYLDDRRSTPPGWRRAYTAEEVIEELEHGSVDEVSLDYDLGPGVGLTGAAVLRWILRKLDAEPGWPVPTVRIHSTHPRGRDEMEALLREIRNRAGV